MLKTTTPLHQLTPAQVEIVFGHHQQRGMVRNIAELTELLQQCDTPEDYYELQRDVLGSIHAAEERRNECVRAAKRLRAHRTLPDIDPLPNGRDQDDADDWELETYIYARAARQLRTVGDGIAWKCFDYDRRVILTLARNQAAGPLYGKTGLPFELGHIDQFWRETKQFALHHDMTNCLRIADVTEFHRERAVRFVEIKATGRHRSAQTQRAQQAVDALVQGGRLPGTESRLVPVAVKHTTTLSALVDALRLARRDGSRGLRLPDGRALIAVDFLRLLRDHNDEAAQAERHHRQRSAAIRRAGIARATHHVNGFSIDASSRSPLMAPLTIYPLPVDDIARIVCDYLAFEVIVSVDHLAQLLTEAGLPAHVDLPHASGAMEDDAAVLHIHDGNRILTVHNQAMGQLLLELLEPRTWVAGMRELMRVHTATDNPEMVFADESDTWA